MSYVVRPRLPPYTRFTYPEQSTPELSEPPHTYGVPRSDDALLSQSPVEVEADGVFVAPDGLLACEGAAEGSAALKLVFWPADLAMFVVAATAASFWMDDALLEATACV